MVNAFKISSNTVHHEDKQVFVCNSIFYTVIYIFMYIYETKISITIFILGTVVFIINHKIEKSFLKGSNAMILRIIMKSQIILK